MINKYSCPPTILVPRVPNQYYGRLFLRARCARTQLYLFIIIIIYIYIYMYVIVDEISQVLLYIYIYIRVFVIAGRRIICIIGERWTKTVDGVRVRSHGPHMPVPRPLAAANARVAKLAYLVKKICHGVSADSHRFLSACSSKARLRRDQQPLTNIDAGNPTRFLHRVLQRAKRTFESMQSGSQQPEPARRQALLTEQISQITDSDAGLDFTAKARIAACSQRQAGRALDGGAFAKQLAQNVLMEISGRDVEAAPPKIAAIFPMWDEKKLTLQFNYSGRIIRQSVECFVYKVTIAWIGNDCEPNFLEACRCSTDGSGSALFYGASGMQQHTAAPTPSYYC